MNTHKVVWSEGLFLKPHHFQQSDKYYENTINFRLNALNQYSWGVSQIDIDKGIITNGSFSLLNFTGILNDGTPVNIPYSDEPPKTRDFKKFFTPSMNSLDVYLAIPSAKEGIQSCSLEVTAGSNRETRYKQQIINVKDNNTGQDEHQIPVAVKRLKVCFFGEDLDDYTTIKIAEIIRSDVGSFSLDEQYIPPSLAICASNHLLSMTGRIYEKLCAKSISLSKQRSQSVSEMSNFGPAEISSLWFLYTVNSHIPFLKHLYTVGSTHPETLYCCLSKLAGELKTFTANASVKDIAEYDHHNLTKTFNSLEEELDSHLEIVISSKFVPILLKKIKENIYAGNITDERLFDSSRLYLAVGGDYPVEDIVTKVPRIVKISCNNTIEVVINAGMPGIKLDHIQHPPASIPVKMGYQYFQLENFGEYWDRIKESKTVAVYLPANFSMATLELFAVKE